MPSDEREARATIAVLDIGKTNVKLSAVSETGAILETLSVVNAVSDAPPWRHHDLDGLGDWIFDTLAQLARRHPLASVVCSGHGCGGVLTSDDPDHGDGTALPMIDYEQPLPEDIRDAYAPQSGSFFDRGSAIMLGATHQARQMYWMQQEQPAAFAEARWFLGVPQYWAWRLSGTAVSEVTYLSAQSHLWNVVERRWTPVVNAHGWQRLMPPFANAWDTIGTVRTALTARYGLPSALKVLAGGHDSSLNYYRYQAAGLKNFALISTGTWIAGLCDDTPLSSLDENRGMTCNSDVKGVPLAGVLCMGGREFSRVAGADAPQADVEFSALVRVVEQGAMAIPSFSDDNGPFPGSAGRGRYLGPHFEGPAERKALALLYCALLTCECLNALGSSALVVLDGSFVRDPLYARLVAAVSRQKLVYNLDSTGVTAGAALLAGHTARSRPAAIDLCEPGDVGGFHGVLDNYVKRWRSHARQSACSHK